MIIADDLQARGVAGGAGILEEAEAPAPTAAGARGGGAGAGAGARGGGGRASRGGRGRGRQAFADRRAERPDDTAIVPVQHPGSATAVEAELSRTPTRLETLADADDLAVIRELYGSRAQTLINILLSWDGFLNWYYPFKASVPFMCPMPQREERALDNMQRAVDMFEIYERVCIRNSKTFMPHAAVFKMTKDILTVGDSWAVDLSPSELLNAEAKRVAEDSAPRRIEMASSGQARVPLKAGAQGPARLITTKGYSTTMSIATLRHLILTQTLRRGDGLYVIPDSRRTERLFGDAGRTKLKSAGIKLENLGKDYDPREDSCLKAFVRMLAQRATQLQASPSGSA